MCQCLQLEVGRAAGINEVEKKGDVKTPSSAQDIFLQQSYLILKVCGANALKACQCLEPGSKVIHNQESCCFREPEETLIALLQQKTGRNFKIASRNAFIFSSVP